LANTAAIPQYAGIKYTNDGTDAHHLAHLFRLGILSEQYWSLTLDLPSTTRAMHAWQI